MTPNEHEHRAFLVDLDAAFARLRSDDPEERIEAARWLREHGDASAYEPLEHVALFDAETVEREGGLVDYQVGVADRARDALADLCQRVPPRASDIARWRALLESPKPPPRSIELMLRAIGARARAMVQEVVASGESVEVRLRAMRALHMIDGRDPNPFESADEELRLLAAKDDEYTPGLARNALAHFPEEPSARVRCAIADLWVRLRVRLAARTSCREALMFLEDEDRQVRTIAASYLRDAELERAPEAERVRELVANMFPPAPPKPHASKIRELFDRRRAQNAADLAAAEREAQATGKEPLDCAKLRRLADCGNASDDELRAAYYVRHPECRTIAEYAAFMNEIAPWGDSS